MPPRPHERVLLIALPVLAVIFDPTLGNPFALKQLAAPLAAWLAVALLAARGAGQVRWVGPALALAAGAALSIPAARNLGAAVWGWSIVAGFALVFALSAGAGTTRAFRRGLPLAFTATGAVVSAVALVQAAGVPGADFGLQALARCRPSPPWGTRASWRSCSCRPSRPRWWSRGAAGPGGPGRWPSRGPR